MSASADVTVIIATAARSERVEALKRAIASARSQQPVPSVLVVVNGETFDASLVEWLRSADGVRYEYLATGSYPAAQRRGRELVTSRYFCFLDDDDELLPDSIAVRLRRAEQHDSPDVVVGNGFRRNERGEFDHVERRPRGADADLMLSLLEDNWFASPSPLFRTATIATRFFDGRTKYFEWTLLAFRILTEGLRMVLIEDRCFRLHDTADSLSKDERSIFATPGVLTELLAMNVPDGIRAELRRRRGGAFHECSDLEYRRGRYAAAWRYHLRSLCEPGGAKFLAYTRRLIVPGGNLDRRQAGPAP